MEGANIQKFIIPFFGKYIVFVKQIEENLENSNKRKEVEVIRKYFISVYREIIMGYTQDY
ncbi:hypothetical protein CLA01_33670 [Chryseobacterium lathyri]|uniref:Uncharacterized protein n=1 Tax=Chryseobacterium lathyri TaxID=395933 RepID=A0A511YDN5_9FLAO|nr:hypothetical protein CLA01_33670 [Chryseobacterium lathyri]